MKKILLLAGVLALTVSTQAFAEETQTLPVKEHKQFEKPCPNKMHKPPMHQNKEVFEKRLKLTDEQKAKAKEIHKKGFEEIKPIMDNLKLKHEEIEAVKRSNLAPEVQAEKIVQLKKECRELKHKARDIQMKNMKEFEAILTDKQKKELKKIKEEGRKKFEKAHKKGGFKMPPKEGIFPPKPPVPEEK
ncbi:Spy/CpxP family protein refolding chaperone [bacterium]|nr:Spy/CpxP family protein refolding chaperone [bacterium]